MLGIGTWEFPVNVMGNRGIVQLKITDEGGKYGFTLRVPGQQGQVPPVQIRRVTEQGNTLHIVARVPQFPNTDIPVSVTFDGDTASGMLTAPFIGRILLKNGRKIA